MKWMKYAKVCRCKIYKRLVDKYSMAKAILLKFLAQGLERLTLQLGIQNLRPSWSV